MLDCLILGDSIAVGTHLVRTECVSFSKGGINSWQWNKRYLEGDQGNNLKAENVIISLGSNDHAGVKTRAELEKIRSAVYAKKVFWILPAIKPNIQKIVEDIALQNNDWVIKISEVSTDGVHPTGRGYKEIGKTIKEISTNKK